jgi:hypothetical protein
MTVQSAGRFFRCIVVSYEISLLRLNYTEV